MRPSLPIGFAFSDDEVALATQVAEFAATKLQPRADQLDVEDDLDPQLMQDLYDSGLFRHFLPKEHGGIGLSVVAIALIRERLSYASVAADEFFASQGIPVQPIVLFGSDEQKRRYLPALLEGRRLYCFCLTEPAAGTDVLGIQTTAEQTADGYVLNGTKRYAFAGDRADTFLVFAKLGPSEDRANITAFLFDRPDGGIEARPYPLLAPGPEWELDFQSCAVPGDAVLGEPAKGARIALGNLDRLRPTVGAAAIGMAQRALDEVTAHLQERSAFGGTLSQFQGIQFALAQASAEVEAARALVYGAARYADSPADDMLVRVASAKAKLIATNAAQRAIDTALQFHGGQGLARGSVTERLYKAIRATRIYEGADEVMKIVIARSLVGR